MKKKFYAGIGSRNTPREMLKIMSVIASCMETSGYILRSGGALGADRAFEEGVTFRENKEIFLAKDALLWAEEEVQKYIPSDRKTYSFYTWKPYIRKLLARNMMQILGKSGDRPVECVACWAPSVNYTDSSAGGTSWAIRCALAYDIPVYNFYDSKQLEAFKEKYGIKFK